MCNRPARLTVIYGNQAIGPTMITMATIGCPACGCRLRIQDIYGRPLIGVIPEAFTAFTPAIGVSVSVSMAVLIMAMDMTAMVLAGEDGMEDGSGITRQ